MLCRFAVKNYKSIRDEIELEMRAAEIPEYSESVIRCPDGTRMLPLALITGMPGSGKTNIFKAFRTLHKAVLGPVLSAQAGGSLYRMSPIDPFCFSSFSQTRATEFSIIFRTDKAEYSYTLHVKVNLVTYENLKYRKLPGDRETVLFDRTEKEIWRTGSLGLPEVTSTLREDLPFLSYLGLMCPENAIVADVLDWFTHELRCIDFEKELLSDAVRTIAAMPEWACRNTLNIMQTLALDVAEWRIETRKYDGKTYHQILGIHKVDGIETVVALEDEPGYVRKLFSLIPYLVYSLSTGAVLVVDGLDLELEMLEYIWSLYQDPASNRTGAQLIATCHGTDVLSCMSVRADELWYVRKGGQQETHLLSVLAPALDDDGADFDCEGDNRPVE